MNHLLAQQRNSPAFSPLLAIGVIFLALCAVEGLLAARFWIQLAAANASDGIGALVISLSEPLVAPFSDGTTGVGDVGAFERSTLIAAIVYLGGAVGLVLLTMLIGGVQTGNEMITRQNRRSSLQHFEHPLIDHTHSRLVGTVTLSMSPAEAERALKMLRLERFGTQLFVIPAAGGCIIAAFSGVEDAPSLPLVGKITTSRESFAVKRALRAIEDRFRMVPVQTESGS